MEARRLGFLIAAGLLADEADAPPAVAPALLRDMEESKEDRRLVLGFALIEVLVEVDVVDILL